MYIHQLEFLKERFKKEFESSTENTFLIFLGSIGTFWMVKDFGLLLTKLSICSDLKAYIYFFMK